MNRIILLLTVALALPLCTGCDALKGLMGEVAQPAQQGNGLDFGAIAQNAAQVVNGGVQAQAPANAGNQGEFTPMLGGADQRVTENAAQGVLAGGTGTRGGGDGLYFSENQVNDMGARIDAFMADSYPSSTMQGQGKLIAACSVRYGVPVDLAMGMLGLEAGFAKRGTRAATNNNPGNIKDGKGKYGSSTGTDSMSFAKYTSMEVGIEAYFKLLSDPNSHYWKHIQSGQYNRIYAIYAPASDGNNVSKYERDVNSIRSKFRAALTSNLA